MSTPLVIRTPQSRTPMAVKVFGDSSAFYLANICPAFEIQKRAKLSKVAALQQRGRIDKIPEGSEAFSLVCNNIRSLNRPSSADYGLERFLESYHTHLVALVETQSYGAPPNKSQPSLKALQVHISLNQGTARRVE